MYLVRVFHVKLHVYMSICVFFQLDWKMHLLLHALFSQSVLLENMHKNFWIRFYKEK